MLHLPILRRGVPYQSVDTAPLRDLRHGRPLAAVSQANPALIARDLGASGASGAGALAEVGAAAGRGAAALSELPLASRLAICRRAAACFAEEDLAVGLDGETQSPADYLRDLSATTGMPLTLARWNLEKLRATLLHMDEVIDGLTRSLPAPALDSEAPARRGAVSHYQRTTDTLGAVLPSNSPGVHGLWLPALALGVGIAARPGRDEPWTPLRLLRALAAAGCPGAALSFYPSSHAGAAEILLRCGRSLLFGDAATVRAWRGDGRVRIHGPGCSKVVVGADQLPCWPAHLELIASSILANGGRSCTNASGVWVAGGGGQARALAAALARRLAAVVALPLADPAAALAAWPDPAAARRTSAWIDRQLAPGVAEDLTATVRGGGRVAEVDGCTFLLPTLLHVHDPGHPLAQTELPFPFCAVVEVPRAELLGRIGRTLVATALTADEELRRDLLGCRDIDHLHLGSAPTWQVSFAQPHEGNLFDLLYRRRALTEVDLVLPPAPPAAATAEAVLR